MLNPFHYFFDTVIEFTRYLDGPIFNVYTYNVFLLFGYCKFLAESLAQIGWNLGIYS